MNHAKFGEAAMSSARIEFSREQAGVQICSVTGELDVSAACSLRRALRELEKSTATRTIVDLSRVRAIDHAAILVLITGAELARRTQRWFGLIVPDGDLRRVVEKYGLSRLVPVYGSMASARRALSGTPLL